MTGPEHYREGERLLAESRDTSIAFRAEQAQALAAQAQGHFLAALVATTATHQHPESVAWDQAINPAPRATRTGDTP